jgi:FAD/FMN-containing dehydrogenase
MPRLRTTDGREIELQGRVLRHLVQHFGGQLIGPISPEYDRARRVWNGLIDRRPGLIARCKTDADVVASVNFAREHRLVVSIRGGGHQVAGTAVCDGGLVIDLGLMRSIQVDPTARLTQARGGVLWGELDRATQAFGLATTGGEVSSTGIAGLTLGGGMGMLQRRFGLSCDNLASATVVTADGLRRTVNEARDPELFWALRGGGRGLGVVTSFEYRLHAIGPEVMSSTVFYPFARAEQVAMAWRDFTENAPDEVTSQLLLWTVMPHPALPSELHGKTVAVVLGLYAGPAERGKHALAPLGALAEPYANLSGIVSYVDWQSALDDLAPAGGRYYWKSLFVDRLKADAIRDIIQCAEVRPSPNSLLVVRHLGGAVARVSETATAYANRKAGYNVSLDSIWSEPERDDSNIAWTGASWDRLQRHSTGGVYLNFAGLEDEAEALARAAHGINHTRLCAVRRQYDPNGVFTPASAGPLG